MKSDTSPPTDAEQQVIGLFDQLQSVCYANAKEKGFWADQDIVLSVLNASSHVTSVEAPRLTKAVNDAFHAMKGDLMHSELGERTEAQRKSLPSDKIEGFTGEEEELADMVIRALDYCGRRKFRLGKAIVAKMRYNFGREYMHGKSF